MQPETRARKKCSTYDGINTHGHKSLVANLQENVRATDIGDITIAIALLLLVSVFNGKESNSNILTTMPNEETTLIKARRPSVVKIQEEEQIHVPAGFDFFLKIIEWAPLWCFLLIDNATYAYTAAFAVTVFDVMFLTYVQHRMGKIRVWPKPLDVIFLCVFGLFTILAWIYQESAETIELYSSAAISAGLAFGFFVSWLLGRPVVRGYQVDKLGEEKASHPVMVHMASRMSVMFTIAFSSAALISAIWPESDWAMLICNLTVGGALLTAYHFYPGYVKNDTDEIAALYEDEIAEWEAKHPELNFAGELA